MITNKKIIEDIKAISPLMIEMDKADLVGQKEWFAILADQVKSAIDFVCDTYGISWSVFFMYYSSHGKRATFQ